MRAILAVLTALLLFVFVWLLIALLIVGMAWAATSFGGVRPGLFLLINVLLVWLLSPAAGAAVAVYAAADRFKTVDPNTIFVAFVSVCSALLFVAFIAEVLVFAIGVSSGWKLALFGAQVIAILGGAKIGSLVIPARGDA